MLILGIETSCDETAVAVVEDGRRIRSNVVASQVELHAEYGGVVPELASRHHVQAMIPVLDEALERSRLRTAVRSTPWPSPTARASPARCSSASTSRRRSPTPVRCRWCRSTTSRATSTPPGSTARTSRCFPLLALIVSGGHSDVVLMEGHGQLPAARRDGRRRGRRGVRQGRARPRPRLSRAARRSTASHSGGGAPRRCACRAPGSTGPTTSASADSRRACSASPAARKASRPISAELAAAFQESVVDSLVTKAVQAAEEHGAQRDRPRRRRRGQLAPAQGAAGALARPRDHPAAGALHRQRRDDRRRRLAAAAGGRAGGARPGHRAGPAHRLRVRVSESLLDAPTASPSPSTPASTPPASARSPSRPPRDPRRHSGSARARTRSR